MYDIDHLPNVLDIGYTGEKNFRKLEINLASWLEEMPTGVAAIAYVAPGAASFSYPTVTTTDGVLVWEITDTDLGSEEGHGEIQVEMSDTVGGVQRIRKSKIVRADIYRGLAR